MEANSSYFSYFVEGYDCCIPYTASVVRMESNKPLLEFKSQHTMLILFLLFLVSSLSLCAFVSSLHSH